MYGVPTVLGLDLGLYVRDHEIDGSTVDAGGLGARLSLAWVIDPTYGMALLGSIHTATRCSTSQQIRTTTGLERRP